MELNRAVAENIKRIRKSKKLSLERTAAMSGVSRSMLGQIERGEANPSVAILGKIAAALKVPAEVLLENDEFECLQISRDAEKKAVRTDEGKVVLRPIFPYDDVTRQESFYLDIYIMGHYVPETAVPGCVCHVMLISGTVRVRTEGEEYILMERDALRFAADRPYSIESVNNSTARLVLMYQYLK
jgi:transcriptional regulator with XRE-family HTH domain